MTTQSDSTLPFREHLVELRQRLVICCIVVGILFVVTFNYAELILDFLAHPLVPFLGSGTMVFLKVQDGFFMFFKVALVSSLVLSAPVIVYQIFMFMAPGLYEGEKRLLKVLIAIGSASFIAGFALLYRFMMPVFFSFFQRFVFDFYRLYPDVNEYVNFVLRFNFYAGILFMIPFGVFIAAYFGIITARKLTEHRGAFVLLAFVVAALLTPPDLLSQIILSAIIIMLFEAGVLSARMAPYLPGRRRRQPAQTGNNPEP